MSIASQALAAAGGPQALSTIQDYTAKGHITYYWAGQPVQGQVTLRGRGFSEFRLDASLPQGTRSWAGGADAAGFAVSAMNGVTINLMPRLIRYYAKNHAHFLTASE